MNPLKRRFNQPDEQPEVAYPDDQPLSRGQGCMLEGLPDVFTKHAWPASGHCLPGAKQEHVSDLSPGFHVRTCTIAARRLCPVWCVEQILWDQNWRKASLIFSPVRASFSRK